MNDLPADMAKLRTSAPFRLLDTCIDTSCGRVRYIRTRSIDIDLEKQGVGGGLSVNCLSAFHTGAAV